MPRKVYDAGVVVSQLTTEIRIATAERTSAISAITRVLPQLQDISGLLRHPDLARRLTAACGGLAGTRGQSFQTALCKS